MDLGGCGGVLSNGFLIHILRPELPVSVCTGVCLLYLFIPPIVSSTVESSSVQLRTRWNVPQCTNMGCAAPPPLPHHFLHPSARPLSPYLFLSLCHLPPTVQPAARVGFAGADWKENCVGKLYPWENPTDNAEFLKRTRREISSPRWRRRRRWRWRRRRRGDGDDDGDRRILLPNVSLDERANFHGDRSMAQRESRPEFRDVHEICRQFQREITATR